MKYKGLVVGAGSAGAHRDTGKSLSVGSHAECYLQHPRASLEGFFDTSEQARTFASEKFKVPAFDDLEKALEAIRPEIVSIAIAPEHRDGVFRKVLNSSTVRAVYCEKPFAQNSAEAKTIATLFQNSNKSLYLNYQRRGYALFEQLKDEIAQNKRGALQSAVFYYTRGLWANASHFIDLALMLFGAPAWVRAHKSSIASPYPQDPNYSFTLGYKNFDAFFIPLLSWEKGFFTGDVELLFEKEKIFIPDVARYESKHIKHWKTGSSNLLEEVASDLKIEKRSSDFMGIFEKIISDLDSNRGHLKLDEHLKVIEILETIKKESHE